MRFPACIAGTCVQDDGKAGLLCRALAKRRGEVESLALVGSHGIWVQGVLLVDRGTRSRGRLPWPSPQPVASGASSPARALSTRN